MYIKTLNYSESTPINSQTKMDFSILKKLLSPLTTPLVTRQRCDKTTDNRVGATDANADSSSHYQNIVCLYDWWLVKADKEVEGKRLAVAGFTSRELQSTNVLISPTSSSKAMRMFKSAPIAKRWDIFTLETVDGVCIALKGLVNEARTIENGFSAEVFNHFRIGFPDCWEAYNEMCVKEDLFSGAGLAKSISSLARTNECGRNCSKNTDSINCEVNGQKKQNFQDINDCSENASEKIPTRAAEFSDLQKHAVDAYSAERAIDNDNCLPPMSCNMNDVCLARDVSPDRIDNLKSCSQRREGMVQKSKTKEPASTENLTACIVESEECPDPRASNVEIHNFWNSNPAVPTGDSMLEQSFVEPELQEPACAGSSIIRNAAPGECSKPDASDTEILNSLNLEPAVRNPRVDLQITPDRPKHLDQQNENDGVSGGNKNCLAFSLPHKPVASVVADSNLSNRQIELVLLSTSIHKDLNNQDLPGDSNNVTMGSLLVGSVVNANAGSSPKVQTSTRALTPSNLRSRKTQKYEKQRVGEERILETSEHVDGKNLRSCSVGKTLLRGKNMDSCKRVRRHSIDSMIRSLSGNSGDKFQEITTKKHGSNLEGIKVFNFSDDAPYQQIQNTMVDNKSKQKKNHRKGTQTERPTQKLHSSNRSCNEILSPNRQCESEAAVGEREMTPKGCSAKKSAQRKLNFDRQESPLTRARSNNLVSPESVGAKRSRSGRRLLPTLDFWRNQIPVYDSDRRLTGIQVATPAEGSKTEPKSTKKR